jgi:hypothetical protein
MTNDELTRLGAAVRIKQLNEELAAIHELFPALKPSDQRRFHVTATDTPIHSTPGRRRRSAEERALQSERMKAIWRKRRRSADRSK